VPPGSAGERPPRRRRRDGTRPAPDLLRDWLASDHAQLSASLERFIGSPAYNVETLRTDLANFVFLLGGNDGEHFTAPDANSR
jgi:hypothetical protein